MNADPAIVNDKTVSHLVDRIFNAVRDTMGASVPRRIVATRDGKHHFIAHTDIDSLEANRNYVNIRSGDDTFSLRWTMRQAQAALDSGQFLRIHRSIILNLNKVRQLERGLHGAYVVTLLNGQQFTSGRAYRSQIQGYLKSCR